MGNIWTPRGQFCGESGKFGKSWEFGKFENPTSRRLFWGVQILRWGDFGFMALVGLQKCSPSRSSWRVWEFWSAIRFGFGTFQTTIRFRSFLKMGISKSEAPKSSYNQNPHLEIWPPEGRRCAGMSEFPEFPEFPRFPGFSVKVAPEGL